MFLRCTLIFISLSFCHIVNGSDNFHEELLLKRLNNAHVYSYFQFTLFWANNLDYDSFKHPHLFSLSLGQIIERYNVRELHVSLTEGFWRYKQWGYPVVDASPGAEILAWFKDDTENVDQVWRDLVNALSGLLCASLNFINEINSMAPNFSFRLKGVNDKNRNTNDSSFRNNSYIRYSTLPREIVCTENLTPWKKLLPCHTSGLITLLNARQIHNTDYHSLGIHFRHVCMDVDCQVTGVELRLTVSLVFDLMLLAGNQRDWSIRKLFGNAIIGLCSVSRSTNVYLDVTSNKTDSVFLVNKQPTNVIEHTHGTTVSKYAVYNITSSPGFKFNLEVYYNLQALPINDIPPILYANRYFAGYGHEYGKIVTEIHNNYADSVKIVYLENIPWYLPIYYQTLTITCNGKTVKPLKTFYKPGKSRTRSYYLEVLLELPGNSVTKISVQFEYVFLKWQEYPPDANHGFYIGSAIITAYLPKNNENFTVLPSNQNYHTMPSSDGNYNMVEMRTEILIITLPTPDFSMPYNVICLACTVVALAFGPIHNITTKKLMFKNALKKRGIKKLVYNVFTFIKKIIFGNSRESR